MAKILGFAKTIKHKYRVGCKHCGALILFDEQEITHDNYCDEPFSNAICPNCKEIISFNRSKAEVKECGDFCNHYKQNRCTYYGTDWRECPLS